MSAVPIDVVIDPPWDLTAEQRSFVEAVRDFGRREVPSLAARVRLASDAGEAERQALLTRMGELGWLGLSLPEEHGGSGGGVHDACVLLLEMGRFMPGMHYAVSLIVAHLYKHFGSPEQRDAVLGAVSAGRILSLGMSEPGAGSDIGAMKTRAVRADGGWQVNGQKTWISNAHIADEMLLICRTSDGPTKYDGISMLRVPFGTPGVEVHGIATMGGREVNDVFFADVVVPDHALVGTEGQGWMQLMVGLNVERVLAGAGMLGLAIRALEEALVYVREREQFGRPIGSFQVVKHRLAEAATEIEASRSFVLDVARRVDADPTRFMAKEASMVKLKATEVTKRVALDCQTVMGGNGYACEYGMELLVRQAIAGTIGGGVADIQRETIARSMGL